jgi:hypothetical protein
MVISPIALLSLAVRAIPTAQQGQPVRNARLTGWGSSSRGLEAETGTSTGTDGGKVSERYR